MVELSGGRAWREVFRQLEVWSWREYGSSLSSFLFFEKNCILHHCVLLLHRPRVMRASILELKPPELWAKITLSKEKGLINLGICNQFISDCVTYRYRHPDQSAGKSSAKNNLALGKTRREGGLAWIWGYPGLHREFQASLHYSVKPCLKTKPKQKNPRGYMNFWIHK